MVSFATGAASAVLMCQEARNAECGFAIAGSVLGVAGDAVQIGLAAGKLGAGFNGVDDALGIFGIALSLPFDAKGIADAFQPTPSTAVSVQGGTVPVSPLYDASGLRLS